MCVLFLLKSFSKWVLYKNQQFCTAVWTAIAMYMSEELYFIDFQCPGAGLEKIRVFSTTKTAQWVLLIFKSFFGLFWVFHLESS